MLSLPLIKREIKSNYRLLLLFMAVLAMYSSVIIAMYDPTLGASLDMMAQSMPDLFAAFGMMNLGETFTKFIVNYLYGFLLICFPLVFTVILSNKLVARYVDRGSMAYLLSTPNNRFKIILSQCKVQAGFIFVLILYVTGVCVLIGEAMFPGELEIGSFLLVNIGLFGLHIFLSGICFFCSCVFNDTKRSTGVGAGVCIAFVMIQMMSQVGDKFGILKYCTPLTLFNPMNILAGESGAMAQVLVLMVCGIMFYCAGMAAFIKRDLPV